MTKKIFKSILFLFIIPLTFSSNLVAQEDDLRSKFLEAESWFLFEEYPDALSLYLEIQRAEPENDNIKYKIGVCYLNDPYQKDKSIRYLIEASKNINPRYKENSFKEKTAPPEVLYFLGNAYLINNKIDSAIINYNRFLKILDENIYDKELVEFQITCCKTALNLMKKPVDFDVYNLDSLINTRYAEKNPVVSGNGNSMVFVYEGPFQDAPFYTTKVNGEWRYPRNINLELGVDGDVYPTSLSFDGTEMFIYRNDDYTGNLYHSHLVDEQWTPLVKLNENINTKYWESHASISRDGQTLYFTSNRKGGYGGLDIYRSELKENGEWGPAHNLGNKINTRYNEDTPFITSNNQMLFYSSSGHYNMGGYDIFYTKRENDTLWSHSINMGYPINTTSDDRFFYPVNNGFGAYYSLFRPEGLGRHDIYYMDIYSDANPRIYLVTGRLRMENELTDSKDVTIYLVDPATGDTLSFTNPDREGGEFSFELSQGLYNLVITGDKYVEIIKPLRITPLSNKEGIRLSDDINLKLIPYQPKIFFGEDSKIEIRDSIYTGVVGVPVAIPLRLEKGSTLITTITVDSVVISSDTIVVEKRRMDLEVIPQPGSNIINLQMISSNGDLHNRTIVIEVEKSDIDAVGSIEEEEVSPKVEEEVLTVEKSLERQTEVEKTEGELAEENSSFADSHPEEQKGSSTAVILGGILGLLLLFFIFLLWRRRKNKKDT